MAQYGKTSYWDERYTKDPEPFDWYQRYSGIKDLIAQYVKKSDNILMGGCGNSRLSEDMYDDGFTTIANVDISRVVIDQMIEKYRDKPTLTWQQMNVCALEFPDEAFDGCVMKAAMDGILCGEGSTANVAKMCQEVSRVLKPEGLLLIVSYGVPDNRLSYLENEDYGWTVTVHTVPKPTVSATAVPDTKDANSVHYVYVCKKGGSSVASWTASLQSPSLRVRRTSSPVAGLFDMFQESDAQKQAKERQFEEMKKMQEKRRDPIASEIERNKRRNVELATRAAAVGNVPANWGSAIDPDSGDRYFFDKETKATQWEAPIDEMVALLEEQQRAEMEAMLEEV